MEPPTSAGDKITIRDTWKENALTKAGKVELVPTEWLWKYYGKDVSPLTNLADGTMVNLDGLWSDIIKNGLCEPLVIRVGVKNKKFRLEAGNHRIQVLKAHGINMIPLTVQIQDECGPHVDNVMTDATHNFDYTDDLVHDTHEEYLKPSEVFKELAR